MNNHDWTVRVSRALLTHRTQQQPLETTLATATNHQHLCTVLLYGVDEDLNWVPYTYAFADVQIRGLHQCGRYELV